MDWDGCADDGAYGCSYLDAANRDPLVFVTHHRERICAGGAVASKVCEVATQFCHQIDLGMASSVVANGFALDIIFLCVEEEADKKSAQARVDGLAKPRPS